MKYYYHHNTDHDFSILRGPGSFECTLGEPEDRTWLRDGAAVVDELNRLASSLKMVQDYLENTLEDCNNPGTQQTLEVYRDIIRKALREIQ